MSKKKIVRRKSHLNILNTGIPDYDSDSDINSDLDSKAEGE